MPFDIAIFLAALGITTLEIVEAAAVGLALYADSRKHIAFLYVALGIIAVLSSHFDPRDCHFLSSHSGRETRGSHIAALLWSETREKCAEVRAERPKGGLFHSEEFERGIMYTGFSVGAIEAFEAAIVLIGLLPNNFSSTIYGMVAGIVIVVVSTYLLRNQVRKVKQANMKVLFPHCFFPLQHSGTWKRFILPSLTWFSSHFSPLLLSWSTGWQIGPSPEAVPVPSKHSGRKRKAKIPRKRSL